MQAVWVSEFGGPEVLTPDEAPPAVPAPGQVVVDVAVADVLFLETQLRSGRLVEHFGVQPPYVPGGAVAGTVRSVGQDVASRWIGRRVAARIPGGGYAERTLAWASDLVAVPGELDFRDAAALLHDGPTALALVDNAPIRAGEWVLITGASGGLGILLVQLSRAAGAQVVATARGSVKAERLREVGADAVVDYSEPGWTQRVLERTGPDGPPVVFDGVGGQIGKDAFTLTARGGRFSGHGAASGEGAGIDPAAADRREVTTAGIEQVQFEPARARELIERALSEAAAGRLRPFVGQTYPLNGAAEAHAAIEAREVVGKTLLLV